MAFVIRKSEAKEPFTFVYLGRDGKVLVKSENYAQKTSAQNGIESVQKNSTNDDRYDLSTSKDGRFYFNLKAANGQIIATSALFASEADRAAAINELKKGAPKAKVTEE